MPYRPVRLDDSFIRPASDRAGHQVPGYYRAKIDKIEPTPDNDSYTGTPGYYVWFRIASGPDASPAAGVGGTISRYCSIGGKEGSQFGIAAIMDLAGQLEASKAVFSRLGGKDLSYKDFTDIARFLEGKAKGASMVLTLADRVTNKGNTVSDIVEIKSDSLWAELRKTPLMGAAPVATSNGPAMSMAEAVQGMFEDTPDA